MDGFRCFTWNKEYFPDPKRMVKELAEDGFKTVAIIDPGIKIDKDYTLSLKKVWRNDYFCKRADGAYMKGKVWPGECYFPDFHQSRRSEIGGQACLKNLLKILVLRASGMI
jgi:alpha-glucosidase